MLRSSSTAIPPVEKQSLRNVFRAKRRALAPALQQVHAVAVAREMLPHIAVGDTVAVYFARDGEVDLAPLMEACWQREIAVAVPILHGSTLSFAALRQGASLIANRYGIAEPALPALVEPTIVVAPVVAFDAHGQRLGMGGGYYDRYFAAAPDALPIGVAHECQRAGALAADPWDVPLAAIVTENGWQSFSSRAR